MVAAGHALTGLVDAYAADHNEAGVRQFVHKGQGRARLGGVHRLRGCIGELAQLVVEQPAQDCSA
jgi:hypothetical protein